MFGEHTIVIPMRVVIENVLRIRVRNVMTEAHVIVSSYTNSPHLLPSSTMTLPALLSSTDRQERQLSHPSSEDRVKSPPEGAYICFFVMFTYSKAGTALKLLYSASVNDARGCIAHEVVYKWNLL